MEAWLSDLPTPARITPDYPIRKTTDLAGREGKTVWRQEGKTEEKVVSQTLRRLFGGLISYLVDTKFVDFHNYCNAIFTEVLPGGPHWIPYIPATNGSSNDKR